MANSHLQIGGMVLAALVAVGTGRSDERRAEQADGAAIARLIKAASVYDEAGMREAVERLAQRGRSCLPSLLRLLHHQDGNVRWQAVVAIDRINVGEASIRPALVAATRDEDADVRGAAIVALARIFPRSADTHQSIAALIRDPQPLVRAKAHVADWRISRKPNAVKALIGLLSDKDWMASRAATRYLVEVGQPAHTDLLRLSRRKELTARISAVRTLGAMRQPPLEAVQHFAALAEADHRLLAAAAMRALADSGRRGWPMLKRLAESPQAGTRARAVRAIGRARHRHDAAVSLLKQRLGDRHPQVRLAAMDSIRAGRYADADVVALLKSILRDARSDHRAASLAALASLEKNARPALAELRLLAEGEKVDYIRRAAERLVAQLEENNDR